jgi:hypothetical protein
MTKITDRLFLNEWRILSKFKEILDAFAGKSFLEPVMKIFAKIRADSQQTATITQFKDELSVKNKNCTYFAHRITVFL